MYILEYYCHQHLPYNKKIHNSTTTIAAKQQHSNYQNVTTYYSNIVLPEPSHHSTLSISLSPQIYQYQYQYQRINIYK